VWPDENAVGGAVNMNLYVNTTPPLATTGFKRIG
jgi:hypothetical protein